MDTTSKYYRYHTYQSGKLKIIESGVITEQPVTLTLNSQVWLTFMCTPTDLEALALGFLYNENIIQSRSDIASIRVCPENDNVDVWLTHGVDQPSRWKRTTGCMGGISFIDENFQPQIPDDGIFLTPATISQLNNRFLSTQHLYKMVGGVHSSGLSDGRDIIVTADDIGRHNTFDKLAGKCLLYGINIIPSILLTTGRLSTEMIQKAARIGASVVISRTSPTAMSIEHAHHWGITLIGYTRRDSFNIYTYPDRIVGMVEHLDG